MITIIALIIGICILGGGLFYLVKERGDRESRRIYLITAAAGAIIAVAAAVSLFIS